MLACTAHTPSPSPCLCRCSLKWAAPRPYKFTCAADSAFSQGLAFEQRLQFVDRRHALHPDLPACTAGQGEVARQGGGGDIDVSYI